MHVTKPAILCSLFAALFFTPCVVSLADEFDPPVGYYSSATSTGAALQAQLHNIIDGHVVGSYNAARSALQVTDQDPNDPDRIILVYDRVALDVSNLNSGSVPGWDNGVSWNREHTWPRALGVDSSGPDNSDLHQLRPSTPGVNSDRANLNFGGAFGQVFGPVSDGGSIRWYPGDADAGMVARQQFYMDVRYDGSDAATEDLQLVNGDPVNVPRLGDLGRLIEWHYLATPDEFERRRNHIIYTNYQNNRNPFIDRPELVWSVFVDQQNDSQIVIAGQPPTAGATNANVNLGRVLLGAPGSYEHSVSLTKNGNDGTYFDVTASGDATSTPGRFNAFRTGGADAVTLDVALQADTSVAGQKNGTITIDNLDVTTQGGTGRGANDGDDQVHLAIDVLSHATPSFSPTAQQLSLELDFGTLATNSTSAALDFEMFNHVGLAGFTSGLELDQVMGAGDTGAFTTDLAPFGAAGALGAGPIGRSFLALMDTSMAGSYLASYTLSFSDEDLPGAIDVGDLLLTLQWHRFPLRSTSTRTARWTFVDLDLLLATGPIDSRRLCDRQRAIRSEQRRRHRPDRPGCSGWTKRPPSTASRRPTSSATPTSTASSTDSISRHGTAASLPRRWPGRMETSTGMASWTVLISSTGTLANPRRSAVDWYRNPARRSGCCAPRAGLLVIRPNAPSRNRRSSDRI